MERLQWWTLQTSDSTRQTAVWSQLKSFSHDRATHLHNKYEWMSRWWWTINIGGKLLSSLCSSLRHDTLVDKVIEDTHLLHQYIFPLFMTPFVCSVLCFRLQHCTCWCTRGFCTVQRYCLQQDAHLTMEATLHIPGEKKAPQLVQPSQRYSFVFNSSFPIYVGTYRPWKH